MKKFLAVAVGALLVGSVAIASADVTFTGDARERLLWVNNANFVDSAKHEVDYGRIRVNAEWTSKGGAAAHVRFLFENNANWNGTADTHNSNNIIADWAYISIPVGPVTIEAGLIPDYSSVWFVFDKRFDRIMAVYQTQNKATTAVVAFDKMAEYYDSPEYAAIPTQDKDINDWDVEIIQKISSWNIMALGIYRDNQQNLVTQIANDTTNLGTGSGFLGTFRAEGPAGPVSLLAEVSYINKKILGASDDGFGGILHAKMSFGAADATLITGFTRKGFQADLNYGTIMMGQAMGGTTGAYLTDIGCVGSPISALSAFGAHGDNTFVGAVLGFKVNNMIKLTGIVAYNDIKDYAKLTEVSGLVRFNVVEGGYIDLGAGALIPSSENIAVLPNAKTDYGAFTELGIKF